MATKLTGIDARPVTRETAYCYRGRPIIIRLEAGGRVVRVKEKGRRVWHTVAIETIFYQAVGNTARDIKAAKAKAKEEAKKASGA